MKKCIICGDVATQWHHVDPSEKTRNVNIYPDDEIEKCIPLCAKCHTKYYHPHVNDVYKSIEVEKYHPSKRYKSHILWHSIYKKLEDRHYCSECGKRYNKLHLIAPEGYDFNANDISPERNLYIINHMNIIKTLCTKCAIKYVAGQHSTKHYQSQKYLQNTRAIVSKLIRKYIRNYEVYKNGRKRRRIVDE